MKDLEVEMVDPNEVLKLIENEDPESKILLDENKLPMYLKFTVLG